MESYFGIYCGQCNEWARKSDATIIFYPAKEIAQAHLSTARLAPHIWAVQQFGEQQAVDVLALPPASEVCPFTLSRLGE